MRQTSSDAGSTPATSTNNEIPTVLGWGFFLPDRASSRADDIRELRGLLDAFNTAKHAAWQTVIKMVTTGSLLALVAGALIKLKVFGGLQ